MRFFRTVVFILLFAFVLTVYLYEVRLNQQSLSRVPDEINRIVAITPEDPVERIKLRDHVYKSHIELVQTGGSWFLEVPVRYPAEQRIVVGLVSALRMASRQIRLQAEKEWDEYGLDKPDMEITLGLPGEKTAVLWIGAQAPVGKAVYARWVEERGYFLMRPEMRAAFRQTVYGLREKRLFRASPDTFSKISVEMGTRSYQWKRDGADWYWFEPVSKFGQKVAREQIVAVQTALKNLHIKEFQDNNRKSRAELGFFMIHDWIRIESQDGTVEHFHFGNEVPDRNAYYGLREGEETVFLVDRGKVIELFEFLKTGPSNGKNENKSDLGYGSPPPVILLP